MAKSAFGIIYMYKLEIYLKKLDEAVDNDSMISRF